MPMLNNIDGGPLPISIYANAVDSIIPVSYTHLDMYKRQVCNCITCVTIFRYPLIDKQFNLY